MPNDLATQILKHLKKEQAFISKIDIAQPFLIDNDTHDRRKELYPVLRDLNNAGMIELSGSPVSLLDTTAGEFSLSVYHTGIKAIITQKGLDFIKPKKKKAKIKKITPQVTNYNLTNSIMGENIQSSVKADTNIQSPTTINKIPKRNKITKTVVSIFVTVVGGIIVALIIKHFM